MDESIFSLIRNCNSKAQREKLPRTQHILLAFEDRRIDIV